MKKRHRIRISEQSDQLSVESRAATPVGYPLYVGALLAWIVTGITALASRLPLDGLSLAPWIVFWLLVIAAWSSATVWWHFGTERISCCKDRTLIEMVLGKLRYGTSIPNVAIRSIRTAPPIYRPGSWKSSLAQLGLLGGSVEIQSDQQVHRFGIALPESESNVVVQTLTAYIDRNKTSWTEKRGRH